MMRSTGVLALVAFALVASAATASAASEAEEGVYFSFLMGLKDGIETEGEWATDGVHVEVSIKEAGASTEEKLFSKHCQHKVWSEHKIKLAKYHDKIVNLSVLVNAGPSGNSNFDWFVLGQPTVEVSGKYHHKSLLVGHPFKVETTVVPKEKGGEASVYPKVKAGSAADPGKYLVGGEEKEGIYIHPPFQNVVGDTKITFELDLGEKPKTFQHASAHDDIL